MFLPVGIDLKKIREWVITAGIVLAVVISCFLLYRLYSNITAEKQQPEQKPAITLNLDGNSSKQTDPQVIRLQGQNTVTREIQYIPKYIDPTTGEKEKTDVQLDTTNKNVYVKINGKTHEVPTEVTEDQKFENGKLVVQESQKTDIEITGPEPSRWTATYMRNQEGRQAFGVGYALSKVVRADVMTIDGEKPFIGVTLSLGDLSSTDKKKDKEKKE